MAHFYPFQALRPDAETAAEVASLPYDVVTEDEVRYFCQDPKSFMHVIRAEGDLPEDADPYGSEVYELAAANLAKMKEEGLLRKDETPAYYIYREISSDHTQTGIVGCASVNNYKSGAVRRHELTVKAKEDDRTRHILATRAQTGPVFLTFPDRKEIAELIEEETKKEPLYGFEKFGVVHRMWKVSDPDTVAKLRNAFEAIDVLYIADGHHRAASSVRAAQELHAAENDEAGRFMAVAFPANDLSLLGYHRFVKDLNGLSETEFLDRVSKAFYVETLDAFTAVAPQHAHEIIMVINDTWYKLNPHRDIYDPRDSIGRLDVSILQDHLLKPILGIEDPRMDPRIVFIGGKDGMAHVETLASKPDCVGFLLYPTDIHDLLAVADDHGIMPPKSTWFEPKLLSGLLVHEI